MMKRSVPFAALLLLVSGAAQAADPAPVPTKAEKSAETAIRKTFNDSGKGIDACTQGYLAEQGASSGQVRIDVTVVKSGWATEPRVQTALPQARTLRLCLEAVAKTWRFPKPRAVTPVGITIAVAKGVKFKVLGPNDKPSAKPTKKPEREGFLKLLPGTFLPYGGPQQPQTKSDSP